MSMESDHPVIVTIDGDLPQNRRAELQALSSRIEVREGLSPGNLAQSEVVYLNGGRIDPAKASRLKWVQFNSAGIGALLGTPLAASSIPVASASGAYSTAVAEMALALLLSLTRKLPRCAALQARHEWPKDLLPVRGENLRGKTAGIIGYGSIGREVARLLHAFGTRILACKRNPSVHGENRFRVPGTGDTEGKIPEGWYGFDQVESMLARTDFVVVTLPATRDTRGLIQEKHLRALPPHALLVNVGRGTVIDEPALIRALQEKRLAGAGLDVVAEEPLSPQSLLWDIPDTIIAPHIASYSDEQTSYAGMVLVENMRRYLAGKPLLNRVDFAAGY